MKTNCSMEPFLKWAGGKRWLVKTRPDLFDYKFERYIEPFLGSGAVFFYLQPNEAILADKNQDLIDTYRAIKEDWQEVYRRLVVHQKKHSRDYYYEIRARKHLNLFSRAAQLIYLNRTCWNGLYRVNRKGEFNVPKGTKDKVLLDSDNFEKVASLLEGVVLNNDDFTGTIRTAGAGDLLFVDPPYTVNHNENGFLKYNESIFSWDDQVTLSLEVEKARQRGAKVVLTNADHPSINELYSSKMFRKESIPRASVLSGKAQYRKQVTELLVVG